MFIFTENQDKRNTTDATIKGPSIILADFKDRNIALSKLNIHAVSVFPIAENNSIRFESRNQYDYFSIHIPDFDHPENKPTLIESYITQEYLLILGDSDILNILESTFIEGVGIDKTPSQMLSFLFNFLLSQDVYLLEKIDDDIENLEEQATLKNPEDHRITIISLRKQLLSLKRYYVALYDLLEELEANENFIFSKTQLQIFHAYKNKVNRLLNTTLSLRDYLTQVREAYQSQLDISLNDTMRFFAVITAIFLPLTLVVGWYGMNLRIPEYGSDITYPIVIIVSIAYVIFSLIYCKKKGWF